MLLSARDLIKRFGPKLALDNVSLELTRGEIVCLLGPSGCGKTTLLRIIAGLETADAGQVWCEDQDITAIPVYQRDFGLMFQDYALFPHKNVFDNIVFGLKMGGKSKDKSRTSLTERVDEMLTLVGLAGFKNRSVNDLSGGEAQRVALARSLAPRPRLLMLDEPLGALDRTLRERLMNELRDILKNVGVTAVYVTHDQAEAFAIADRVVVMNAGRIEQIGPPEEIYRSPASLFVARFLGLTNLSEGRVIGPDRVASAWGELTADTAQLRANSPVMVLIRPEAAILHTSSPIHEKEAHPANLISGNLVTRSFRGRSYQIQIQPESGPHLTFELTSAEKLPETPDSSIKVSLDPAGIVLLPV